MATITKGDFSLDLGFKLDSELSYKDRTCA